MESILLFGVFEGLIVFLLIFLKRKKTVSDYLLSSFFLVFTFSTFLSYLEIYNRTHEFPFRLFFFVSTPFLLLHWPILWLYVKSLTDQHFRFRPVYLLNLLPFVLCIVLFTFEYYTKPLEEKIVKLQSESFKQQWDYPAVIITMTLSSLFYLSWAAIIVRRYNRRIKVYFSETSRYDLYWLRVLMIASAVIYTIIYLAFAIDLIIPLAPFRFLHQASFILGSVYIIVLGFFGHRQGNIFSEKTIGIDLQKSEPSSEIKYSLTKKENDFIIFLLKYMTENKPFLIPEITLSTLASELEVTPDYLSGIINNKLGKNFFDFINHYRIEEFKTRSMEAGNKKFTLLSIAYDCGFNSKATFNRVFKNVTGITPGEYANR